MSVIVKVPYDRYREYRGMSVTAKVDSKKHDVLFRVYVDDFTLEDALKAKDSSVIAYEYIGLEDNPAYMALGDTGAYVIRKYESGNDLAEADVADILERTPKGVVPVICVPEGYSEFEFMCRMFDKYPKVRFCGGVTFQAIGCRFGCCGADVLDYAGVKHDSKEYMKKGCSCGLRVFNEDDLELSVAPRREAKVKERKDAPRKRAKTLMFSDILGGCKVDL